MTGFPVAGSFHQRFAHNWYSGYKVGPRKTKSLRWCVYNSKFTMVYDTQMTTVHGVYKPIYDWGGATL